MITANTWSAAAGGVGCEVTEYSEEEEKQLDNPSRTFFRWYEDWLDEILSKEDAAGGSE
jgi:hypothetical protein